MGNARIGALRVDLGMNTAAFEKGADLATRKLNAFSKNLDKMGAKMRSVGKSLTLGITAPLAAFGVASFKAAADAEELQDAFNRVFKGNADAMNKWADSAGDIMGRATTTMQQGALDFGVILTKMFDPEQAAKMSQALAERAVDIGSMFNMSASEAMQKFRSGLSGESEPLKSLGVVINETAVKAKALELGLGGVGRQLTEQEKVAARYAIILEQTGEAQGNAAETAGSAANQVVRAKEAFTELAQAIGKHLLPVITPMVETLRDWVEKFGELSPTTQKMIIGIAALAAVIGPIVFVAGAFATAIGGIATAVGVLLPFLAPLAAAIYTLGAALLPLAMNPAVMAFAGVITGIYLAWKYWDQIVPILERLWAGAKQYIAGALTRVLEGVLGPILAVKKAFFDLYDAVVGHSYIPDMVDGIQSEMSRLDRAMVDPAQKAAKKTKEIMRDMATEIRSLLDELFPDIARLNAMKRNLELLDKSGLKGDALDDARYRAQVLAGFGTRQGEAKISDAVLNQGPLAEADQVKDAAEQVAKSIKILGDKTGVQTVRIAKSFAEMAQGAVDSLRGLISAIKGGGFLDILSSVFGIIDKFGILGGSKGLGGLVSSFAGLFADGGRFPANKFGIVGENGPELFMPGRAGYVVPNHALGKMSDGRGGVTVNVDARGATDPAAIEQAARRAVLEAAPTIVAASENRTLRTLRRPRLGGMGA